jgi:hypothetical protein
MAMRFPMWWHLGKPLPKILNTFFCRSTCWYLQAYQMTSKLICFIHSYLKLWSHLELCQWLLKFERLQIILCHFNCSKLCNLWFLLFNLFTYTQDGCKNVCHASTTISRWNEYVPTTLWIQNIAYIIDFLKILLQIQNH